MYAADCPLPRPFEAASDALAARDLDWEVNEAFVFVPNDTSFPRWIRAAGAISDPGVVTRHVTPPPRMVYRRIPPRIGRARFFLWVLFAVLRNNFREERRDIGRRFMMSLLCVDCQFTVSPTNYNK